MAGASVAIAPSGDLNPGQPVHQRPARRRQRIHGQRRRRQGADERRHDHCSGSGFHCRIPRAHQQLRRANTAITAAASSTWSPSAAATRCMARPSSFCATRTWTRAISFRRTAASTGKISSAARWAARSRRTRSSYFADYQGTRTAQGIDTGLIAVPTLAERAGNFQRLRQAALTGTVGGPYLANLLSQKLGYAVAANEPYYTPDAAPARSAYFPARIIPQSVWSAPAQHLLQYIPLPNDGPSTFSTGAEWRDRPRRQRQLSSGCQQRTAGAAFGLLFLRRLYA